MITRILTYAVFLMISGSSPSFGEAPNVGDAGTWYQYRPLICFSLGSGSYDYGQRVLKHKSNLNSMNRFYSGHNMTVKNVWDCSVNDIKKLGKKGGAVYNVCVNSGFSKRKCNYQLTELNKVKQNSMPAVVGAGFSRANPIPNGSPGTWAIMCDKGSEVVFLEHNTARQDTAAAEVNDYCRRLGGRTSLVLGGCGGWGQQKREISRAYPKSMTITQATRAKHIWIACGKPGAWSASPKAAINLCEIKSGVPCRAN